MTNELKEDIMEDSAVLNMNEEPLPVVTEGFDRDSSHFFIANHHRPEKVVCVGGNYMLLQLGIDVRDSMLKEWQNGFFLGATMPKRYPKVVAIATSLGPQFEEQVLQEFAVLHRFNSQYYVAAKAHGADLTFMSSPPAVMKPECGHFDHETGVTLELMQTLISSGFALAPDRNDMRTARLLGDDDLFRAIPHFNDKNLYFGFLCEQLAQRNGLSLPVPDAVVIASFPHAIIEHLLNFQDGLLLAEFSRLLGTGEIPHTGEFDSAVEYFVKVSAGAGGNSVQDSMTRLILTEEYDKIFRGILLNLKRRHEIGSRLLGLQLLAPIDARDPNASNPVAEENREYFSPCLTIRIAKTRQGMRYQVGQVADQVLKDAKTWVGSYWQRTMQEQFLVRVGHENVAALASGVYDHGYHGYFATDFIQCKNGQYAFVVDPNGRMNGNDILFFARNALTLSDVNVESGFLGVLSFACEDVDHYAEVLKNKVGKFQYNGQTGVGLVLFPTLKGEHVLGTKKAPAALGAFINPTRDKSLFTEFFEANY